MDHKERFRNVNTVKKYRPSLNVVSKFRIELHSAQKNELCQKTAVQRTDRVKIVLKDHNRLVVTYNAIKHLFLIRIWPSKNSRKIKTRFFTSDDCNSNFIMADRGSPNNVLMIRIKKESIYVKKMGVPVGVLGNTVFFPGKYVFRV